MSERESDGGAPDASEVVGFLDEVPLFASLPDELREEIAAAAEIVRVPAATWLFHEGDPGDVFYAVRTGRLEVVGGSSGVVLGTVGRGSYLGELALLTGEPRSASVRAVRDSELVALDREQFQKLVQGNARFAAALMAVLGRRLANAPRPKEAPRSRPSVLAVVPLSRSIPVGDHVRGLHRAMSAWGRVAVLDQGASDAGASDDAELGRLLDRCERDNDLVLLSAGADAPTSWRDFCLRQADRALLLTDASAPPPADLVDRIRGRDLAFWTRRPPDHARSRPWLDALEPRTRHWVQAGGGEEATLQRAARRIFGRSLGLVMSGGGARGLAHIGVVAAFQEHGLQIDRYGGSSVGSLISAMFAAGLDADEVTEVCRRELVASRPFADYTLPRHALIRSTRARRMFQRVFGETYVEELPLDWFGVTSDLVSAESIVHRRGPVRYVVGASMSLPGLAPPVPWGSRLLSDGGILNNLPVDVMAETGEGPVVAVEVMRRWNQKWSQPSRTARPGRRRWLSALQPERRLPTIMETIACATGLGSRRLVDATRELAWLTITPDLQAMGLLEWNGIDAAIAEGRRSTAEALDRAGTPPA